MKKPATTTCLRLGFCCAIVTAMSMAAFAQRAPAYFDTQGDLLHAWSDPNVTSEQHMLLVDKKGAPHGRDGLERKYLHG